MADTPHPDGVAHDPAVHHETTDVNLRGVLGFAAALVAVAVAVHLLLWWLFVALQAREDRAKRSRFELSRDLNARLPQTEFGSPAVGDLPPRPRLEGLNLADPDHDVGRERTQGTARVKNEREEEELTKGKPGVVHVPIEQAMRLVAEGAKPTGHAPAPVRYDQGIPGTGGGSNSGRDLPEAKR